MGIFYGWWIVLVCFTIGLYVGSIAVYGFTAFIEPIRAEFGWSYTQISFAGSLRVFASGLFGLVMGVLIDRFGSRKVIFCGAISVGLGLICLSLTQALGWFYCSTVLIAFGTSGSTTVAMTAAVANWFDKRVGLALGIAGSAFGVGGLLIPLIVWLIDAYGWRNTLVIFGVGMWALGIPLSFVIRSRPEQYGYIPDGGFESAKVSKSEKSLQNREIGFKAVLKQKSFVYLNIAEYLLGMTTFAVTIHVMPYLSSIGMPRATAGMVAAFIPFFRIFGGLVFGRLGDIFIKRYVMALTFCLMALGMLAFCFVQTKWVMLLFLFLFPIGYGGGTTLRGSILREYFGRGSFGKMIGIVMISGSTGGLIGPTLAGWAFDIYGTYRLVWLVFCGLITLGIGLTLKIKIMYKSVNYV